MEFKSISSSISYIRLCTVLLIIGLSIVSSQDSSRNDPRVEDNRRFPQRGMNESGGGGEEEEEEEERTNNEKLSSKGSPSPSSTTTSSTSSNRINMGGYSRTYWQRRYEINRNTERQKHTNRSVQTETRLTFHRNNGEGGIYSRPTGAHILTIKNNTFSFPLGINSSSEFSNVTYFNGVEWQDRGDDNVHPLSHHYDEVGRRKNENDGGPYVFQRPHPCDQSSCYPATGNLLIGRESGLSASSTCGLDKEERYCIVSHLEDKKKCFRCDSTPQHARNPLLSHKIENILHRFYPGTQQRSWWQSENGVENVTIQLDLEAEFHFTHLIITFKTFRPSAMLIERSFDFGKTWKVYRYFADVCEEAFPGIPKGPATVITDVICESRYSAVAPSTEGEVIFRVLPRNLPINDPYSQEVQNLLKMTNLRINFTKLHTLGDDRLDKRQDIQEKYYYSIYEMVVRGSCSCYGHASKCTPKSKVEARADMVYGQCECTHHTKGKNCEECQDFFQDLPWKPAIGKQTNACKTCECNNHATSCHFDAAVFEASGNVSGGVCDDCQHNSMGLKCEQCKPFFYLTSYRNISDIDACQPCDCDPRGSLDGGLCDSKTDIENTLEAGRCHCKQHVTGRRCDECSNGYWQLSSENPEGCQECSCNILGTVGNQGCNIYTGECTCKRYVTGRDCNQCLPEYWGLSDDRDGCKPCDCDVGGAYDNNCDVVTGQCRCRAHVTSRNCSVPEQGYFAPVLDHLVYEAELAKSSPNCQVIVREPFRDGRDSTWTGVGFVRAFDDSYIEFTVDNIVTSMDYDLVIRYEPQQSSWTPVSVIVTPEQFPDPDGPCANSISYGGNTAVTLREETREAVMYPPICLEAGNTYKIRLHMEPTGRSPSSVLVDSIVLIPRTDDISFFRGTPMNEYRKQQFDGYRCPTIFTSASKYPLPEECKKNLYSVGYFVFDGSFECGCDLTGSTSSICDTLGGQCVCKLNVVGRTCDRCAPGTYGFGPEGCRPCECNPIGSLDNFCDAQSGQCRCRPNTFGRACDQCQPGFWNFPNCQRCNCNGHADICDSNTGTCVNCRDNSTGVSCDRCIEGYYGDPRLGFDIPCRSCPCPGTIESGHSFAARCALDRNTNDVVCECSDGYSGPRCDACADNYYGDPEVPGGGCYPCSCNNNIDISRPGNCDIRSGDCLQCLFNTEGAYCEHCKAGFYGDAINQMCQPCICNLLGTNATAGSCDRVTGQCECLPQVIGKSCDRCEEDTWKIASGEGCEACECDPIGSHSTQCNLYDGQCDCTVGFGGRKCDQCQTNYWGNPKLNQCYPCDCDQRGSATSQCDRTNGSCVCIPGIGGKSGKCDECARGYIGYAPNCSPCGECFDNWDRIIGGLKDQTSRVVDAASKIKQQGATGAYTREFDVMKNRVDEVNRLLESSSVSTADLDQLQEMIDDRKATFTNTSNQLDSVERTVASVSQRILLTNVTLEELERKVEGLQSSANSLKDRAINLQEANVEGALNLTREAKRRSDDAVRRTEGVQGLVKQSEKQRRRVQSLLTNVGSQMNTTQEQVTDTLVRLEGNLANISNLFPNLNTLVCDRGGNPCDSLCGGAGCGKCGGISCEGGAVSNADSALKYAQDAFAELKKKDRDAEDLLRTVTQTKAEVDAANNLAQMAHLEASRAKNSTEKQKATLEELDGVIQEFLDTSGSTPNEIRTLAEEVLSKNITLRPEQIDELAQRIRDSIDTLTDIDEIIRATEDDLNQAERLKDLADHAASQAGVVLQEAVQTTRELGKAGEAQKGAERAIEKAGEDIAGADLDLKQIGSETSDAEKKAIDSLKDVEQLKLRLEELQKKNLQNERRREQARNESDSALRNATAIGQNAAQLKQEHYEASRSLETKLKLFEEAREKEGMQNRANRLANNVNDKLKELQEMEKEYGEHERKADDLGREIDSLSRQMEQLLLAIKKIEDYHRTCNS